MKILFITQFLPYPPDSGGKMKSWNMLQLLAKEHDVFLVSFGDKKEDLKHERKVRSKCSLGIKTFITPIITSRHKKLSKKVFLSLFGQLPFRVRKYFLPEARAFVRELTKRIDFEVVYCDHLTSAPYLRDIVGVDNKLKVYDEHNISSQALFTYLRWEKNFLLKLGYLIEGIKFKLYEIRKISIFDIVFAISMEDRKILKKYVNKKTSVLYLPTPVKVKSFYRAGSKVILFVGLMSWWPNEQGVDWFLKKVFPLVSRRVPEAEVWIVGANPSKKIRLLASNKIKVLGYVKDLARYYRKTAAFIVPIKAGGGIKIKILDALAHGLPVVSTTEGAFGISAEPGKEFFLGDSPESFAKRVVEILSDSKKASELSKKGLACISNNYNKEKTLERLKKIEEFNREA